jgi:hypothetical protein
LEERIIHLEARIARLESRVSDTQLHSSSFWTRAFTVWGHWVVAHLIIAIPFVCIGLLLS